ncbi:MAG: hypothetical protein WKF67_02335 [Rubrobacteraceae bacterium]
MNSLAVPRNVMWAGVGLVAVVGLIHLIEAPEYFDEYGAFYGLAFLANAAAAAVAAVGIYGGIKSWGWTLGAVISGGAFVLYLVSRTIGLPGLTGGAFFEPIGLLSLLVEGLFVVLYARVVGPRRYASPARGPLARG